MSKRRWLHSSGMRRADNVIHVSPMLMWELSWVRKMGLEDIDWDPGRYCVCCRAERAARGEAVEALAPPSKTRPDCFMRDDGEHATPSGSPPRSPSGRGGMPLHLKLVRPPRPEPEDT
ncbi:MULTISPECIES: hypothetical protein [Sorangium]|uniref:Uncharacterized protein n=1 Tax=Sorangium cellulosum TaxID=56 RepID=A0A4P2QH94_SORCE|nr:MULTISPECIES: hypothetical protein [Sorangium]AUX29215.1 uncharacterized protein SOCE836_013030 [Sorangium cellulosum]WCQ88607.1 hypothetical protein NQZ70_01286 [Sorangium sp. Soce836]